MKKFSIVLALCLFTMLGFACSKKATVNEGGSGSESSYSGSGQLAEIDVAAQTITDGVIYFEFNKFDIAPEYKAILNQKATIMRQYPSIRVRIEGNCDARGTQEYNLALGERRARAAYEYMVLLGVNPNQMEIISYGKERPAVAGSGEQVWALNRRNDFRVIAR